MNPQKIEICAEIVVNSDKTAFYVKEINHTVFVSKLIECSCKSNRVCLCNLRTSQIMEKEDYSNTHSKRKKIAKTNQELRPVKCNHCYNRMPWIKYWSFDHECFHRLASYSYDDDDNDDITELKTFLPQKSSYGWYHNCTKCKGLFDISQWRYKKIWYHTHCTEDNKNFFENLRKIDIIKYNGMCICTLI